MTHAKYEAMSIFEGHLQSQNIQLIAGIDEAGRGPLAGPVVSAACILHKDALILGLDDSKKLSEEQRLDLFKILTSSQKVSFGIGLASVDEIDNLNILQATLLSMQRAIHNLPIKPEYLLIDGNKAPKTDIPTKTIVKGDSLSISIAAASIIAKVTRDQILDQLDENFPNYGFKKHKGYGTKEHLIALEMYGPCPEHRKTFAPLKYWQKESQLSFLK